MSQKWGLESTWGSKVVGMAARVHTTSKALASVGGSLHELWKVQEVMLQSCELFPFLKLLYITFLVNI